jgi:hypothetical protein
MAGLNVEDSRKFTDIHRMTGLGGRRFVQDEVIYKLLTLMA